MKLAVVGGGVSGLYAAWHLSKQHEVIVLEADRRLGGHADTHQVQEQGRTIAVDSGFIVFNEVHYPLFAAWLQALGISWHDSDMSFSVSDSASGLEYNATNLDRLFCQRRNLLRPRFLGLVRDMVRFYRQAPDLLTAVDEHQTLAQWLSGSGLGRSFAELHLLPMASALWSAPMGQVGEFPMRHLLAFMDNHGMLTLGKRPPWRTVNGGSARYVEAAARTIGRIETATPVRSIRRLPDRVEVVTDQDALVVDGVILACHSDQALALLADPNRAEREVLGAIAYQPNEVALHTDTRVLPRHPRAWAAWNVRRDRHDRERCRVSYYMNSLQKLDCARDYIVSLNQTELIDPARIIATRSYQHPVFTTAAVRAQQRWDEINGPQRTWYCGAWWGWGFHEDGVRSARRVVDAIEAADRRALAA
ncbi:MAG: FAD-dependent oxidoreductase [Wenzhouxiangella sp.]|nr:FAD-dependent oxidoreductase [Wenzhouxiangella sp.]TVR96358.1 MAG: FAD-dependent oxidoreductase [Wenzhouxiangellaceae bacterium]